MNDLRCKSLAAWGLTEGHLLGAGGAGMGGMRRADRKGSLFSAWARLLPRILPVSVAVGYLRGRAVLRRSLMVSVERKSRAPARQPEPGYLWVSAGRGARPRAVSDLNSYTYRKLEPLEAGALVIPALGWPGRVMWLRQRGGAGPARAGGGARREE